MDPRRNGNRSVCRESGARRSKGRANAAALFRAFADQTRLRILRLLEDGSLCVGDLVEILRAPQPTVSRHLAYLRHSGFVDTQQHGLWIFYALAPVRSELQGKLLDCIPECTRLMPEFDADAARARDLRRTGGCCPEGRRLMQELEARR